MSKSGTRKRRNPYIAPHEGDHIRELGVPITIRNPTPRTVLVHVVVRGYQPRDLEPVENDDAC